MKRTLLACAPGSLLPCGPAAAAPGEDASSTVRVMIDLAKEEVPLFRVLAIEDMLMMGDAEWSDEALVELRFEAPAAFTGTAAGTPRTAP